MSIVKVIKVGEVFFTRHGFESENIADVSEDMDAFIQKMKSQPAYSHFYHAYSFSALTLTEEKINHVLGVAKETYLSLRVWENKQSGTILFCFADPDTSEDSGWAVFEKMQAISYEDYGMPSSYEWEMYGLDIDPSLPLLKPSDRAFLIGEVGILL